MDEYIKREEIRRAYEKLARSYMHGEPYIADWKLDEMIEELPASDVVPVRHGQWIDNIESGEYLCSACNENALSFRKDTIYGVNLYEVCLTDYCPNCGAKMDEEVDT